MLNQPQICAPPIYLCVANDLVLHPLSFYFRSSLFLHISKIKRLNNKSDLLIRAQSKNLGGKLERSYVCAASGAQVSSHHIFTLPRQAGLDLINK